MCQKCVDCCREIGVPEDRMSDFLWSATSFPFDEWPRMGETIRNMWERSGHDVDRAIALAHEDMDAEYEAWKIREEKARLDALKEGAD